MGIASLNTPLPKAPEGFKIGLKDDEGFPETPFLRAFSNLFFRYLVGSHPEDDHS